MEDQSLILSHREAGVLTLTLNRPAQLNSFTPPMHRQLALALQQAEEDDSVRCLLLTGAGRAFCAGQDLNNRSVNAEHAPPDLGLSLERDYNPLIHRLTTLAKPVIAAVNGVAAGAGASLALACDIVIAGRSASFIQAFCRLGLVPDSGSSWLLPRTVGHARAMGMALLGDKIEAEQAHRWGMIWQLAEDNQLAAESLRLAQQLATQPTFGLGLTKRALYAAQRNTLDQQLDLERDLQRTAGRTADYREGVEAFFARRAPQFSGKAS